jgi:dihydrodipicolinate reductase
MGTAIVRALARSTAGVGGELEIVLAAASSSSKSAGLDIGELAGDKPIGVKVSGDLPPDLANAQVAIDFSRPELSLRALNSTSAVPRACPS